jgi:hypothetical protein
MTMIGPLPLGFVPHESSPLDREANSASFLKERNIQFIGNESGKVARSGWDFGDLTEKNSSGDNSTHSWAGSHALLSNGMVMEQLSAPFSAHLFSFWLSCHEPGIS